VRELVALTFANDADEVLAEIEPRNLASTRTVEKCGFKDIGTFTAHGNVLVSRWILCNGSATSEQRIVASTEIPPNENLYGVLASDLKIMKIDEQRNL